MKEKLEKQIADLRQKFLTLQSAKLTKQMRADVQECLRVLDAVADVERRGVSIRKTVQDLVDSLYIHYAQTCLERRQRQMSRAATKKFWEEEREDR